MKLQIPKNQTWKVKLEMEKVGFFQNLVFYAYFGNNKSFLINTLRKPNLLFK